MAPVPFAAAEERFGRAFEARLANATARFNGGDAVSVVFHNGSVVSSIGQPGVFARQPQVSARAEWLAGVEEGTSVEVDHPAATAVYYLVRQRLPDDLHAGWVLLLLEPAL